MTGPAVMYISILMTGPCGDHIETAIPALMAPLVERESLRKRSSKTQRYRETDWVSERENEFQREELLLQYTGLRPWQMLNQ